MTLNEYYERLPLRDAPRSRFIREVADATGKTEQTVRNWVLYGKRPQDYRHVRLLSEMTGIGEDELWK